MAKVTGPLMSLDASGTVAKTATFSKWKGRNYVRVRVVPANPKTEGQLNVRSILGTIAKACKAVLTSFQDTVNHHGSQFFIDSNYLKPTAQSWISWLQKQVNSSFDAYMTAYGSLDSTHKGYWDDAALAIGLSDYMNVSGDSITAGAQLYVLGNFAVGNLNYTGFASGIDGADSTETSDFGDYVHASVA